MKHTKKLLSIFLSLCMLLSITASLDFSSYAAGSSIQTATSISLGSTYTGYITVNNEKDVYKFTLSSSGRISVSVKANIECSNYYLYDANGNEIKGWTYCYWNENTKQMTLNENVDLTKGTYYFAVSKRSNYTGNYNFKISFTNANESFSEMQGGNNNSIAQSQSISLGNTYKGQIALNDDKDVYKFTLSSSGRISVSVKANIECSNYYLYDANGNEIKGWTYCYWNENTKQMILNENVDLTKGTYYFTVSKRSNYTGNYSFTICTHKYTTKVVKPTYTSEGYTLHTCTRCKKSYKDKKTKKLVLKNTTISKLTKGKKAFTVKWKKQSAATGYQIQYSTSSKFKSAKTVTISKNKTTSKKIPKLKAKKKYYVRVRTYKTVKVNSKNTKVYSSWSKSKSVKTK